MTEQYFHWVVINIVVAIAGVVSFAPGPQSNTRTQEHKRIFEPKVRLLSEEEFNIKAHIESQKAVQQLKEYCQSHQCKPWKIVTRLENPQRFAKFVESSQHVSDDELLDYVLDPENQEYEYHLDKWLSS